MAARVPVTASSVRPNVLAYPSPTTARYLIFVAALICSGLFVGNWVHNDVRGDEWVETVKACGAPDLPGSVALDDSDVADAAALELQRVTACTRDVEQTRAAFIFGGAALMTVTALMLFMLTPRIVERRRRLRMLGPKLTGAEERFADLADRANVSNRVEPRIGPSTQRDAFSYGIPLSNRVALPPAVVTRWRDTATFDAVVAHELAHVARRDVSLAWLVRSIGYVMVPILLIPIVVSLFSGELVLLLQYSWRVVLLAIVVLLLSNSLLRTREYDADIHAATQLGDPAQMEALLGQVKARAPGRWAWLKARHPTPQQRIEVVARPEKVTRVDFEDGVTSGFLTALAVPLLVSSFGTLLATFDRFSGAAVASAVLVGPILGASVGLALWRAAVMVRPMGSSVPVAPVALGVGIGFAAGQVMSLGSTDAVDSTGVSHPLVLLVSGLAGAGATVLSASVGEMWADVMPGIAEARRGWLLGLVVNAVLFSSVLWAANQFQGAIQLGGWDAARWVLVSGLSSWVMAGIVALLAAAVLVPLVWRPKHVIAPSWLIEAGERPTWLTPGRITWPRVVGVGLAAGLIAVGSIVLYRWSSGVAEGLDEQWDRYWTYSWVSSGAAVAASLALQLFMGRRGAAAGLLSGVVASGTASLGYLLFNASLGGGWDPTFVARFVRTAVVLGFYATLLVSVAALLVRRPVTPKSPSSAPALVAAVVTSALLSGLLLVGRGAVVPPRDFELATPFAQPEQAGDESSALFTDLRSYLIEVVPDAEERYLAALSTASQVESGEFRGDEVVVLQTQVQQPLQLLWDDMAGYVPVTREVAVVHADLLDALEHTQRGMALLIAAYQSGERSAQGQAMDEFTAAARLWGDWRAGRDALADKVLED